MTSDNDFSAYVQTSSYGTQAVTDISVVGKDITIGRSANNVTIGNYASGINIGESSSLISLGSIGVPTTILGTLNTQTPYFYAARGGSTTGDLEYTNAIDTNFGDFADASFTSTTWVPGVAGKYMIMATALTTATQTGLVIRINNSSTFDLLTRGYVVSGVSVNLVTFRVVDLEATDIITVNIITGSVLANQSGNLEIFMLHI
jgi:hypothetical protein